MQQLVGLYIEDEEKNIILMQGRFALKGIRIIGLGKFPQDLKNIYDYVIDNQVDFLIVDHELEKAYVSYKGIDMLKYFRKLIERKELSQSDMEVVRKIISDLENVI